MASDVTAAKAALRAQALAARQAGDGAALDARLRDVLIPWAGRVLAGYWPMRDEADPRGAMTAHDGPVVLPVVIRAATPLVFRRFEGALERGTFGTSHPPESAAVLRPDVLIVPLAAFDRSGHRIGYGGGFYDRTLAQLRAQGPVTAIGLAWAGQEIDAVPAQGTTSRWT